MPRIFRLKSIQSFIAARGHAAKRLSKITANQIATLCQARATNLRSRFYLLRRRNVYVLTGQDNTLCIAMLGFLKVSKDIDLSGSVYQPVLRPSPGIAALPASEW